MLSEPVPSKPSMLSALFTQFDEARAALAGIRREVAQALAHCSKALAQRRDVRLILSFKRAAEIRRAFLRCSRCGNERGYGIAANEQALQTSSSTFPQIQRSAAPVHSLSSRH